jgi:SAM-dependent methyltransferase
MNDKSAKTAMSRKVLPTPTRYLLKNGMLKGDILDYGCGKCHDLNNQHFTSEGYDPHHRPVEPAGKYDTIICNFVLNTIDCKFRRALVVQSILDLLVDGGVAYISVRNDVAKLRGRTTRGTWQGYVIPPGNLIHQTVSYRMYALTK